MRNDSFIDDMDELDEILMETSEYESIIESVPVLAAKAVLGGTVLYGCLVMEAFLDANSFRAYRKEFDAWAQQIYKVDVKYHDCKCEKIKLTEDNVSEIAKLFGKSEKWMKDRIPEKGTCWKLLHNDKLIYAEFHTSTVRSVIKKKDLHILEKAFTPNAKRFIGYYSALLAMYHRAYLSKSGAEIIDTYRSHGYLRRNKQAVLYNHEDNYNPDKYGKLDTISEEIGKNKPRKFD